MIPGGAAAPGAAGGAQSLDPRQVIRVLTVYQMKDRAGVVGAFGVSELLRDLLNASTARVHAIGHCALEVVYRKQVDIVGKILTTLRFVAFVPAAALPQGRLLMAATYILVGGYIVLAGADYVDAPALTYLDRVSGVRRQVEVNLTQP